MTTKKQENQVIKTREDLMNEATLEVSGVCGINWFGGTNDWGECLYGFTPFGAYTIYDLGPHIWAVGSLCDKEIYFESEIEAIEAVIKDYKSRVAEMFNNPHKLSDRLEGSWGYEDESEEDDEVE